jgi:hypothetical protein
MWFLTSGVYTQPTTSRVDGDFGRLVSFAAFRQIFYAALEIARGQKSVAAAFSDHTGGCMMIKCRYLPVLTLLVLGGILPGAGRSSFITTAVAAETPQDMLAAQVRAQGVACGKALAAKRDAKRSRPDHEVWTLKCDNATYRVSRYPDMGAKIELLR